MRVGPGDRPASDELSELDEELNEIELAALCPEGAAPDSEPGDPATDLEIDSHIYALAPPDVCRSYDSIVSYYLRQTSPDRDQDPRYASTVLG